jgi:hypothetical protein
MAACPTILAANRGASGEETRLLAQWSWNSSAIWGGLKPGDVSHPAGCEAIRPGVLVQAWRLADGQAETASVPRANS